MKIFDNIMSWKKPEMLDLAKELNIKGRSKMNKGEVAESISEILKPAKSEMVLRILGLALVIILCLGRNCVLLCL